MKIFNESSKGDFVESSDRFNVVVLNLLMKTIANGTYNFLEHIRIENE